MARFWERGIPASILQGKLLIVLIAQLIYGAVPFNSLTSYIFTALNKLNFRSSNLSLTPLVYLLL